MKKLIFMLCAILYSLISIAQSAGFSYQAVIRNAAGELIKNKTIGIQITILKSSESGTQVYSETQTPVTNANGLVTFEVGKSNPTAFNLIDWADGPYFLKTEVDPNGGTAYSVSGTSQLLNVPYAMYALKAANGIDLSASPKSGDILYHNGTGWILLGKGANGQTLRLDNGIPGWAEPGYALPMVTTNEVSEVIQTSAVSGGNVIATGFTDIIARGVCWSTNQNPIITDAKTAEGTGIGTFTSKLTNLQQNTTYYLRAYATNGAGTAYGNQVSFKTILNVVFPTVTTATGTNITSTAVTSGGNVTATGGDEVTSRGVCWSDHQNPTIDDNKTNDGAGTGEFQSQISGLIPGTYYVRAYATNNSGTGYGAMINVTTEKTLPVLTTKTTTEISAMGCVSGGNITSAGGSTISERGICWSESPNPTIANENVTSPTTTASFSAAITKASPGTTYYVRAYAKNEIGVGYGDHKTFVTADAQYYTSFESGLMPSGWSGQFSVKNENAVQGSFSLQSLNHAFCDAVFTINLTYPGQICFFYSFSGYGGDMDFSIDDIIVSNYPNDGVGWKQVVRDLSSGVHKFKWHYNFGYAPCYCYIDQITITK